MKRMIFSQQRRRAKSASAVRGSWPAGIATATTGFQPYHDRAADPRGELARIGLPARARERCVPVTLDGQTWTRLPRFAKRNCFSAWPVTGLFCKFTTGRCKGCLAGIDQAFGDRPRHLVPLRPEWPEARRSRSAAHSFFEPSTPEMRAPGAKTNAAVTEAGYKYRQMYKARFAAALLDCC
jgi:hypothetical protein